MSSSPPPIPSSTAVGACAAMAILYVALLYSPTVILRLPPPVSFESFLLRRFACAAVSSAISVLACAFLLGSTDLSTLLLVLGIRSDHVWKAVVIPLLLTSLPYAGTITESLWRLTFRIRQHRSNVCRRDTNCEGSLYQRVGMYGQGCVYLMSSCVRNISVWRHFIVAPFTEELVFRACMIPLLLCGGYKMSNIIFFCPIFFSLAHLNHFLELFYQQRYSAWKAFTTVGPQLCYTVIFGWYTAFLFIRTGNLIPPVVAHIFCNMMGLPVLSSSRTKGVSSVAFVVGSACYFWLLFPATDPDMYNDRRDDCSCWHGYCNWK